MSEIQILALGTPPEVDSIITAASFLQDAYQIVALSSFDDAKAFLLLNHPQTILLGEAIISNDQKFPQFLFQTYPHIPVILVPAQYTDILAISAIRQGFFDCLPLPLSNSDLQEHINRALDWYKRMNKPAQVGFDQQDPPGAHDQATLYTILEKLDEGLIITDPNLKVLLFNPKACEIFSIQQKLATGKHLSDIVQNQELLEIADEKRIHSTSETEVTFEGGHVYKAHFTRISNIGLVITLHDISRLKQLDRIKGDFVHNVSHNLRNPLTAILGYAELIDRMGPTTDLQKEFIHRVQISVQSITALINDLLELGRIEAGFDTRKEAVNLATIIRYIIDGQNSRLDEMSQKLVIEGDDDLPDVLGNPIQLRQMLNNLISNAMKYSPEGGTISINTRLEGGQIIIQVSDNGKGIPPADQPFIFDKFYRAGLPGTGLGLAIVKSIVENHNGRIWVDSTPGEGATFTVVIPTLDCIQT